ncbi:MAG: TonB-dependent receptor, partial [Candidatus Omnitrophica bacterium]|nr:TonB-dependent receptor [Candidatus Omnitrophota bacterium]
KVLGCLIGIILLGMPPLFAADVNLMDKSLEDLLNTDVSSSGFFKMNQKKAPGYTTVFTAQDIDLSTARTMHDLLDRYAPGVSMSNREFGSMTSQRGIAVDASAKTVYMLDGTSLAMRQHFGYMLPLDLPFMKYLDRVEVVNGPGAIVHGSGAISGFVNMIPKSGKDYQGWDITTEYGIDDRSEKLEVGYGKAYDKGSLYVYGGEVHSFGYAPSYDGALGRNSAGTELADTDATRSGLRIGRFDPLSWQVLTNWEYSDLKVLVDVMDEYYKSPTQRNVQASDFDRTSETRNHNHLLLRPQYTFDVSPTDKLELTPSVYLVSDTVADRITGKTEQNLNYNNAPAEADFSLKGVYKSEAISKHQIAYGGSIGERLFYMDRSWFHSESPEGEYGANSFPNGMTPDSGAFLRWYEYSAFGEDVMALTDKLTLSTGLRYDAMMMNTDSIISATAGSTQGTVVSVQDKSYGSLLPRVAAAYAFTEDITGKLSYQRGFRYPDVVDFINMHSGTDSIKSEVMDSIQANYEQTFLGKKLSLAANPFLNVYRKTIGYSRDNSNGGQTGNVNMSENFESVGYELVAKYNPDKVTSLLMSYSEAHPYNYPKAYASSIQGYVVPISEDNKNFEMVPSRYVKSSLRQGFLNDRLGLTTDLTWWAKTKPPVLQDVNGNYSMPLAYGKSFWELSLAGRYNVTKNTTVRVVGENLFPKSYTKPSSQVNSTSALYPSVGQYSTERRVYVEVRMKF